MSSTNEKAHRRWTLSLVGVRGLEPPASWSQTRRATNCATPRCFLTATTDNIPLGLQSTQSILDLRKPPQCPEQMISADIGLSSLDVSKGTSPSDKPLSARADLPWQPAILRKSSIAK